MLATVLLHDRHDCKDSSLPLRHTLAAPAAACHLLDSTPFRRRRETREPHLAKSLQPPAPRHRRVM
ncbi:hypothetical protein GGR04_000660 [Aureimonas pseudogalii]|uniref:Uncharacterized protein n=1 Tax=Aureimonas pseudogalii TaxID=1744844 RepID=A0A7W6EFD4_9HYPH|nr:hypothetical protein [Aureimonas pseudogalii]